MAKQKQKPTIVLENGSTATCQEPVVVSASRSTDIPAFYCDWFFHRLNVGYSAWTNPFNGVKMYVSYAKTRFIVFWSKNPRPLLGYLDELKKRGIGCYIQYSLNDYEDEKLERGVPPIAERIDTFKKLVNALGVGSVVWRFDPLMLTDDIDIDKLLSKIEQIGDQLKGYTEKLVFSFADIALYRKVKSNLEANGIPYHEWTEEQMKEFAARLVELNKRKGWNYKLATCGEKGRYPGIEPNHCVDDELIIRRGYHDKELMTFLNAKIMPMPSQSLFGDTEPLPPNAIILDNGQYAIRGDNRDKGQREFCGCMKSKDIGQYNTCIHMCEYCYANTSKQSAAMNYKCHKDNPWAETITGK
jgi:DNA repair photolyase